MHKKIVANWKMNGNLKFCQDIASNTVSLFNTIKINTYIENTSEIIICPPTIYLSPLYTYLENESSVPKNKITQMPTQIHIGGQNCSNHDSGAYTGEISAKMLKEVGCKYVIVGHSERRINHGENNDIINNKIIQAYTHGLIPIICIGESIDTFNNNETENFLYTQIQSIQQCFESLTNNGINIVSSQNNEIIIAYEPIWAINNGKSADNNTIEKIHKFIKETFSNLNNKIEVLYGGSVNENNSSEIIKIDNVDGFLVGGASIKIDTWKNIILSTLNI